MTNQNTAPYAALILRVSLGVLFLAHGALKLFVFTPAGTVGFFESLGLPGFFAYLTILAEVGGGAALNGGWEFPAFWAATLVVQALLGDGAYAVRTPKILSLTPGSFVRQG